jgi:type II secretory pathway component PulJ
MRARGVTLVEVMLALLLTSTLALGLTQTLISAQRARERSGRRLRAVQLATAAMERLRAGQAPAGPDSVDGFTRAVSAAPWAAHPELSRVEVTVSWNDGSLQHIRLVTLMRR